MSLILQVVKQFSEILYYSPDIYAMLSLLVVCCALSRNDVSYEIGSVHCMYVLTYFMEKSLS